MSMYIYASLPETYGAFNQIREDNYPFNWLFTEYLKTLVELANTDDMDIFTLLGYIENELMGSERLPDLPKNEDEEKEWEKLTFRYPLTDRDVIKYYKDHEITNKMITQLIIRTTIRLSQVYGTSLLRLIAIISNIKDGKAPVQTAVVEEKVNVPPAAKIAITEPKKPKKTGEFNSEEATRKELLKKIDELTQKGSELVKQTSSRDDEEIDEDEDDGGQVVETNPHLKDFL